MRSSSDGGEARAVAIRRKAITPLLTRRVTALDDERAQFPRVGRVSQLL
jgi:hypothetical protein